ncbi:hypothetical protein [Algoriphagus antarcticus]|uniref:Uncharacterized protein n=1 Tax=Algoriphagus antarcticus TaxID=238540 RepID=A0A3E0DY68_9BACT|nr:hypothetical protein [Algoriphagus antarcticus]REG87031.1 hypothetical protein C8N25_1119 [Algoriphagus antarcticus]
MKHIKSFSFGIFFLASFGLCSCVDESTKGIEKEPYFDLKGFIEEKIQEIDSVEVSKVSQVQEEEKQATVIYTTKDWEEEFGIFTEADINNSSSLQSYETTSSDSTLAHELYPNSEGKVKYIKVTYFEDEVSSVSIKIADDNLFYSTTTLAEMYMNKATNLIDHYSIETTQKIWFLDPNEMKIQGTIIPKY